MNNLGLIAFSIPKPNFYTILFTKKSKIFKVNNI